MSKSQENELKLLISKRENLFEKAQIMFDLGNQAVKDRTKVSSFKIRFSYLDNIYQKFEEYDDRISSLQLAIDPESTVDGNKMTSFETLFFAIKVIAADLLASDVDPHSALSETSGNRVTEKSSQPRLPKIDIPTWDSSLKTWVTFYDKFKALVHNNPRIDSVEKFHYLMQSVSGPALNIIKSLPLTSTNYPIVWDMLVKKYQNKRVLGADILDRLFNCPNYSTETIVNLNSFIENFCDAITALKAVQIPNLADFIFLQLGLQKLPFTTRKQFENQHLDVELPSFKDLSSFIENQAKVLEISKGSEATRSSALKYSVDQPKGKPRESNSSKPSFVRKAFLTSYKNNFNKCPVCHDRHSIYKCPTFLDLTPNQRRAKVRSLKHCFNCLKGFHMVDKCESPIRCASCKANHHTLLHPECPSQADASQNSSDTVHPQSSSSQTASETSCLCSNKFTSTSLKPMSSKVVLLGTAIISIRSLSGAFVPVRALIDSGSQVSFITSSCAQRLGLQFNKCDVTVAGLAQRLVSETKGLTTCLIKPVGHPKPQFTTEAIVLHEITSQMPSISLADYSFDKLRTLNLADPNFDVPGPVDFLIAADIFPFLFDGKKFSDESGLTAMSSIFGWVVTGKVNSSLPVKVSSFLTICEISDDIIKKFWEVEEPPTTVIEDVEESNCEKIFLDQYYRQQDGRYVVPLPFRSDIRPSYDSHSLALKRLLSLEKRLSRSSELKDQYQSFLDEYELSHHMTKVPYKPTPDIYYIPHHAVINYNSSTTKLRVVFDGSANNKNQPSLNKLLHIGPKLQPDIVAILIRFMLHKYVFIADIRQMYRQILIRPEDRSYQHIIWRRSPSHPIEEFQLNTVTYGLSPSSYLALRTLRQLAHDEGARFPQAVDILMNDVYIDDIISGGSTKQETKIHMSSLINLLQLGGFELRKWGSNCADLLSDIPSHFLQTSISFDSDGKELLKILGVQWNAVTDSFTYRTSLIDRLCTKRNILSHIARIYDPIGWLSPLTFRLKCLIQHLWRLGLNWDDDVPDFITDEWVAHCKNLHLLSRVNIPRYILDSTWKEVLLVGFCDASEKGYSGVVYLCVVHPNNVKPHLLLAKSKVAPLKTLSIPRLELSGAVLLSKLLSYCFKLLSSSLPNLKVFAFSDSTTVLSWLQIPPYQLKTFVAARVNQIIDLVPPSSWYHIASESNPADCSSRGLQPQQLIEHSLWWLGPCWLSQPCCEWPLQNTFSFRSHLPELKNTNSVNTFHVSTESHVRECWIPIEIFSSLSKLIRVTAWCLRYLSNLRLSAKSRSFGHLTIEEMDQATCKLVREVQWQSFPEDMKSLSNKNECTPHLRRLCPFLDSLGCLRVGGRLTQSFLPDSSIHPLILPKKNHFTNLIIDYYHITYLHAGPRILQSLISRKYWILSVRNTIRSRLSKCNICFKCKPIPLSPKMADLPQVRVTPCRPFLNVGVDFGGPFLIRESRRRHAKTSKCYLSLFVCMATKAVHLEVVSDLSTDAFLAAFDRFISRRGLCVNVYTDCGTNFVGARRYLNELYKVLQESDNYITKYLAQKSIHWYLNIPTASHWGGLWEAGIRCTKYHLKRVLKDQILTFEELTTLFSKIEAVLNSRPLCSLSPDPGEINVLTPGHFLIGAPLAAVPEYDLRQENLNRLDRWQFLQHATQHFWDRWSREYLHTLQQRAKWFHSSESLKVGDVVLILTDSKCPPTYWSLGRVKSILPGKDGVVRAAAVNTPEGKTLLRPLVKLCPLPSQ